MYILYNNHVEAATITASPEDSDYSFSTAFKDERLSRVGRTTSEDLSTITFDLGSEKSVDKVMIYGHNFSSGAEIILQANYSNSWTSPAYSVTLFVANPEPAVEYTLIDEDGSPLIDDDGAYLIDEYFSGNNINDLTEYYLYYKLATTQTFRYWRLVIYDSNSDNYTEISKVFLGQHLEFEIDTGIALSDKSNSTSTKSESGGIYGNRKLQYKAAEFTVSVIDEDLRQNIKAWWNAVDVVKPFYMLIWEDDLDVEEPLYCNLTKELNWKKRSEHGGVWDLGFEVEECK